MASGHETQILEDQCAWEYWNCFQLISRLTSNNGKTVCYLVYNVNETSRRDFFALFCMCMIILCESISQLSQGIDGLSGRTSASKVTYNRVPCGGVVVSIERLYDTYKTETQVLSSIYFTLTSLIHWYYPQWYVDYFEYTQLYRVTYPFSSVPLHFCNYCILSLACSNNSVML